MRRTGAWVLLLALLAFAFARPLWTNPEALPGPTPEGSHVVVVDTSASMGRPGVFEQALALDPTQYESLYLYGRARFAEGELEQAADLWRRAHEALPDEFQAATLRIGSDDLDEAVVDVALAGSRLQGLTHWEPDPESGRHEVALGVDPDRFFEHFFGVFG